MNPEQIKDEIRKLNSCERIALYRWINEEIAGRPGIGADRSLQIRKEIERMCSDYPSKDAAKNPDMRGAGGVVRFSEGLVPM